jgi:tetratricopeptide (TPR) repeat protein
LALGYEGDDVEKLLELCNKNSKLESLLNRWDMQAYDQNVRLLLDQKTGLETLLLGASESDSSFNAFINSSLNRRVGWNGLLQLAVSSHLFDENSPLAQQAQQLKLNNHAIYLSRLGEHTAALNTAKRAAEIYEKLALASPAAYEPDLAMSLNNLANRYSNAGEHTAALSAAKRAVAVYGKLYQAIPAAYERTYTIAKRTLQQIEAKAKSKLI